jgi:hypothetical protein
MKYPDQPQTLALLEQWHAHYIKLTDACNSLKPAFGSSVFDTPIWSTIWQTFDLYTETLAESLGATEPDIDSWLHYFWYECDMGKTPKKCSIKDVEYSFATVHELCALIMRVQHAGEQA